jgi:hypothetical protein
VSSPLLGMTSVSRITHLKNIGFHPYVLVACTIRVRGAGARSGHEPSSLSADSLNAA